MRIKRMACPEDEPQEAICMAKKAKKADKKNSKKGK
jgi:hypothetical protein